MRRANKDEWAIATKRTLTEMRLQELLVHAASSMTLEEGKKAIFEADVSDFSAYLSAMVAALKYDDVLDMTNSDLQIIQEAWNNFSHRSLDGRSPVEVAAARYGQDAAVAWVMKVQPDFERIDRAVLALLLLGLHGRARVWKDHDCSVLRRLYERGYISDPGRNAKSVALTESGLAEAQRTFEGLFCLGDDAQKSGEANG
jgi:hypothetical protein